MPHTEDDKFFAHEDDRRILIEWVRDMPLRSPKAIVAKTEEGIGDHYHRNKEEVFFLVRGTAKRVVVGDAEERDVVAPRKWIIPRNVYHIFVLEKDAVLISAATDVFSPDDEIRPSEV